MWEKAQGWKARDHWRGKREKFVLFESEVSEIK